MDRNRWILLKNSSGNSPVVAYVEGNVGGGIEMMGQRPEVQDKLFYSFSLDDQVPRNHLLRGIDQVLDLGELRTQLAPFYSHTGRPSIDPELILRMLIVGYCFGIRSERRLCEEVHLNLAYRWFGRLELDEPVPNHSTFSKNRHGRFREGDTFRCLFETVLRRCMSEGKACRRSMGSDVPRIMTILAWRCSSSICSSAEGTRIPAFLCARTLAMRSKRISRHSGMPTPPMQSGAGSEHLQVQFPSL